MNDFKAPNRADELGVCMEEGVDEDGRWRKLSMIPKYKVYESGQIYSEHAKDFLTPQPYTRQQYRQVSLHPVGQPRFKNYPVHQVVCQAFHGPRPHPLDTVDHDDGDVLNNTAQNLRWLSPVMQRANQRKVPRISQVAVSGVQLITGQKFGPYDTVVAAGQDMIDRKLSNCQQASNAARSISEVINGKKANYAGIVWRRVNKATAVPQPIELSSLDDAGVLKVYAVNDNGDVVQAWRNVQDAATWAREQGLTLSTLENAGVAIDSKLNKQKPLWKLHWRRGDPRKSQQQPASSSSSSSSSASDPSSSSASASSSPASSTSARKRKSTVSHARIGESVKKPRPEQEQ